MAAKQKLSRHKFAGRNNGPSRQRYWAGKHLQENKVKNLMRQGMTRAEATAFWIEARGGRRMKSSLAR